MPFRIIFLLIAILVLSLFLSSEILSAKEVKPYAYDSKGKRDPFIPLVTSEVRTYATLESIETADDLILEGILWDPEGGSIAIINGVVLKEGDVLSNICIQKITRKKVFLTINEQNCEINLQKEEE